MPRPLVYDDSFTFRNKLVMVMGLQRSGTSALIEALGQDPNVQVETEAPDGPIYDQYFLRPEPELRQTIWRIKRRVLLKPISEIQRRSVQDVLEEYRFYGVKLVWIYRDPVNVWSSANKDLAVKWEWFANWVRLWNEGNQSVLDALRGPYRNQIAIVRYEDLIARRETFEALCAFLDLDPRNNLFWRQDEKKGRQRLDEEVQRRIEEGTGEVLAQLDSHRLRPETVLVEAKREDAALVVIDLSRGRWEMHRRGDTDAKWDISADRPTLVRVDLAKIDGERGHVQLAQRSIAVEKGKPYTISFWGRAAAHRVMGVSLCQTVEPWRNLGRYFETHLTKDWQPFHLDMVATETDTNGRLLIDLGASELAVELADIVFSHGWTPMRRLSCHEGAQAAISYAPERPNAVRIDVVRPGSRGSAIQYVAANFPLVADEHMTVSFRVRSDKPRSLGFCVGQANDPWKPMGIYRAVNADANWQVIRFDFRSTASGEARLYFDLGGDATAVEIADPIVYASADRIKTIATHNGAQASVDYPLDQPGVTRVTITKLANKEPNDIQVFQGGVSMTAGRRYAISFRLRADRARRVSFCAQQAVEPWSGLGFYHRVEATPAWKTFYFEFVATKDDDNARVTFDVGASDIAVEIADARIEELGLDMTDDDLARLREILDSLDSAGAAVAGDARHAP